MSLLNAIRNIKYRKTWAVSLLAFASIWLSPSDALAFGADLATPMSANLVTPLETLRAEAPTTMPEGLDALPSYNYTGSGVAIAVASPQTVDQEINTPTKSRITLASAIRTGAGNKLVMVGQASYYSRAGCLGCNAKRIMANGQPLNDNALTMAIGADKKHLVGYNARVTNLATGLSATVTITDTGGFHQAKYGNRVADLTIATKEAIGMRGGLGQVRVEVF